MVALEPSSKHKYTHSHLKSVRSSGVKYSLKFEVINVVFVLVVPSLSKIGDANQIGEMSAQSRDLSSIYPGHCHRELTKTQALWHCIAAEYVRTHVPWHNKVIY